MRKAALFIVGAVVLLGAVPASAQGVANAGSIKIATLGSPTSDENNEPHLSSCVFRADFYGFREGNYAITITGISPTGGGVLANDTLEIADSAKGNTYQTSKTHDLTGALASITPHPQQGYHIRYDAKKSTSPGKGTKTKVFWLDCIPGGTSGTSEVRGKVIRRLDRDAAVLGTRTSRGLATTGPDVENVALAGVMLVALGAMISLASRRGKHARR